MHPNAHSELLISPRGTSTASTFGDGDIVMARSVEYIRFYNLRKICFRKNGNRTREGLLPINGAAGKFQQTLRQFRYEVIGRKQLKVINQFTGEIHEEYKPYLPIELNKKSQLGTLYSSGRTTVYFGGRVLTDDLLKMDAVWAHIENMTPIREIDHLSIPLGRIEKRRYLAIKTPIFNNARMRNLQRHKYDKTNQEYIVEMDAWMLKNGVQINFDGQRFSNVSTTSNPLKACLRVLDDYPNAPTREIVNLRASYIDWRNTLELTARQITDVEDTSLELDLRETIGTKDDSLLERRRD